MSIALSCANDGGDDLMPFGLPAVALFLLVESVSSPSGEALSLVSTPLTLVRTSISSSLGVCFSSNSFWARISGDTLAVSDKDKDDLSSP